MTIGVVGACRRRSATIANPTQLDSRDVASSITLSNSNKTATKSATSSHAYAFGKHGKVSGKWRYQVTVDALGGAEIGVGIACAMLVDQSTYLGSDNNGAGYGSNAGTIVTGGSGSNLTSYAAGDVIDVYVDLDAGKIWFAKNGAAVTGVIGVSGGLSIGSIQKAVYPAVDLYYQSSAVTFNFGDTAFTYPGVGGFSGWTDAETYSATFYRRIGLRVRSLGWFAQAFASLEFRDTSGGSSTASGGTPYAERSDVSHGASLLFDGNSTTWWGSTVGSTQNQPKVTVGYDFGADAARSTAYVAIQSRDGGGGGQDQAPTDFITMVGGASSWQKVNFRTTTSWPATTPGAVREFAI